VWGFRGEGRMAEVVYFLQAERGKRLIKIGTTTDLPTRLRDFRRNSPVPLRLLGTIPGGARLERAIHEEFVFFRVHGEWFLPGRALLQHVLVLLSPEPPPLGRAQPVGVRRPPDTPAALAEVALALACARRRDPEESLP
jgi:hypothetical protein